MTTPSPVAGVEADAAAAVADGAADAAVAAAAAAAADAATDAVAIEPSPPPFATHDPTTRFWPWRLERYIVVSAAIMSSSTVRPSRG